jgi:hypothetical protein
MILRGLPRLVVAVIVLATAAAAIGAIGAGRDPGSGQPRIELTRAHRALKLDNSRRGRAVVKAQNMAPGEVRRGRVSISVTRPARVVLVADRLDLGRGPMGGVLADALSVRLKGIGGGTRRYRDIYRGPVSGLGRYDLGRWRPGESDRIQVRVRFPADAGSPESLQGAQTSFRLLWRAAAD